MCRLYRPCNVCSVTTSRHSLMVVSPLCHVSCDVCALSLSLLKNIIILPLHRGGAPVAVAPLHSHTLYAYSLPYDENDAHLALCIVVGKFDRPPSASAPSLILRL